MTQDNGLVTFRLIGGETKDLQLHAKLFAVPNRVEYKVVR